MIEPIKKTRDSNEGWEYDVPITLEGLRDKLNEVIEAVNEERRIREWLEQTGFQPRRTAPWGTLPGEEAP